MTVRTRVVETESTVKVAVVARRHISSRACAGLVKIGRLTVRLDEPIGGRRLIHADVSAAGGEEPAKSFDCPRGSRDARKLDGRRLIGLEIGAARALAADFACTVRVVARDGRSLPHTQDLRRNRINIGVAGGTVVAVDGVY